MCRVGARLLFGLELGVLRGLLGGRPRDSLLTAPVLEEALLDGLSSALGGGLLRATPVSELSMRALNIWLRSAALGEGLPGVMEVPARGAVSLGDSLRC